MSEPVVFSPNVDHVSLWAERLNPTPDFLIPGDNSASTAESSECIQLHHNEGRFISLKRCSPCSHLSGTEAEQNERGGGEGVKERGKRKLKILKGLMSRGLR